MTNLEWSRFLRLAGDPRNNWELLCREVVRRHYGRFGPLRTRKQHPGVEFHLAMQRDGCDLGAVGRHWGWQCRWYDPSAFTKEGQLRSDQRRSIQIALAKSAEYVPGLTDWVLWTKDKLGAADARWFDSLDAPFTLHHWDEETLVGLLGGPAEMLRQTWFGELVLDQATLTERRREALAPIEQRYVEELHVRTPAELETEELLLGHHLEHRLLSIEQILDRAYESAGTILAAQEKGAESQRQQLLLSLSGLVERLGALRTSLEEGQLPSAEEIEEVAGDPEELEGIENLLRQTNLLSPPSLPLLEVKAALSKARETLTRLATGLRAPMLAIVGGAGVGKTHLAASLTGPDEKAGGVLILGRQFGARIEGDDLARFAGLGSTREELLEALDALGVRERRRVPLVIDGINESEDPSAWQLTLSRLRIAVARFEHVFIVVTVRPTYRRLALPQEVPTVELSGLSGLEEAAIRRYFSYYKIDAQPETVQWWRPSPLLLSVFCRTVNPERRNRVQADQLPASLTEVFEAYLDTVYHRIAATMKVPAVDVAAAMVRLGEHCFWAGEQNFDREEVAEALGDHGRARWSESLRFQFEAEELLIRDVIEGRERIAWSYDLLAGHVFAKSLLDRLEPNKLATERVASALEAHPLSEDILTGLAGILGARGLELTAILKPLPSLAAKAALASLRLPGPQVSMVTVAALDKLFSECPADVLEAITETTLRRDHPLNARLLDTLLGELEVWRRDLTWTEWMQDHSSTIQQVGRLSERWRTGRDSDDDEAALAWLSWVLTATDRSLRDAAIQGLYRLGKRKPEMLFARTLKMLQANDPTIAEGLLAASYGVVMASQDPALEATSAVLDLASALRDRLLRESASQPTFHWLIREYAYRTVQFAAWISDGEFAAPARAVQPPLPQPEGKVPFCKPGDAAWTETSSASWLGAIEAAVRALPARDSGPALEHRLQEILGEIRARVVALGWNRDRFRQPEPFPEPDENGDIPFDGDPGDVGREKRFGDKYGSIAFHEAIGRLSDREELGTRGKGRFPALQLDPSFPESAIFARLDLGNWVDSEASDEFWVTGRPSFTSSLIYRPSFGQDVRWVAVNGFLWQEGGASPRHAICEVRGLLAFGGWSSLSELLKTKGIGILPENPVESHCFAGEAPWSPTFDTTATEADGSFHPQVHELGSFAGEGPAIELLGVDMTWDSRRSALNSAQIGAVPSKAFSHQCGLRKVADRPEFIDQDGRPAAISVSPRGIGGWHGTLLFVRENLLRRYCTERGGEWGWALRGEHHLLPLDGQMQSDIATRGGAIVVVGLDEVAAMQRQAKRRGT
ncbi:MAG TPA: hypothetical protein VFX44_07965 [Solirubrobacterales bacterium]|nr:hypothetical protein [Solirubrobacterales bacterium]